ncbi:Ribose transport system permease protein rbsC [uncultured Clostridium sp.]|uniref:ABC transporter permease n=1 Tax=uncultured Clostridium sp. TaxID=59620 RepID=UPI000822063B|nr:ABC transporter permease [uncultured Clostridium sp.]SCJ31849.1 Ribose transport system permease protein rbsC [uncultured Clostridium sp.]
MKTLKKLYNSLYSKSTILAFLLLVVVSSIVFADKNFLSTANVFNILLKVAKNGGFLALGMTFVILCGEIDLSVGAVFALSGVVMGLVGEVNPYLGIVAGLMVGVISGALIGFMNTKMRISSWISSLAMLFALRGLIQIIAKKSVVISGTVLNFANAKILQGVFPGMKSGISILIPILFIITFICMYISRHTKFGMSLYAVGGNSEASRMMGINVNKVKIKAFICSGFIAALSGVLLASSSGSATLSAGNTYETYAIAMCAIGGVKLSGGEGKFSGTFFGMLIYFIINTIFTYLPTSVSVHWQSIIMGILVLVSVGVQSEYFKAVKFSPKALIKNK